jgi:hypothetical protein
MLPPIPPEHEFVEVSAEVLLPNDPKLRSGLPKRFSKKIWHESGKLNGDLPCLMANPPSKQVGASGSV